MAILSDLFDLPQIDEYTFPKRLSYKEKKHYLKQGIWVSSKGIIDIKKMNSSHIFNTIRVLHKKLLKYPVTTKRKDRSFNYQWIKKLAAELKERSDSESKKYYLKYSLFSNNGV